MEKVSNKPEEEDNDTELIRLLKTSRSKDEQIILIMSKQDVDILNAIIEDRKALGRVWTWFLYVIGSVAALVSSYAVISGAFIKWVKQNIGS